MNKPVLSVERFAKINEVFNSKGWPIHNDIGINVFDCFCSQLATMSDEEVDLMLELTRKFVWINSSQYMCHFLKTLDNFCMSSFSQQFKTIVFCPLLPEDDFGKIKSSVFLMYQIKGYLSAIQNKYSQFNLTMIDSPCYYDPPEE